MDLSIIMYHYVRDAVDSRFPEIRALEISKFVKQLEYVKENFHPVTMEEVIDCIDGNNSIPSNSILLTFDDAYSDHYHNVYPLLKEFNIQGSFFVPVESMKERKLLDVNKIHIILASVDDTSLIIEDIKEFIELGKRSCLPSFEELYHNLIPAIDKNSKNVPWAVLNDSQDVIFIKRILQYGLPMKERISLIEGLFSKFVDEPEDALYEDFYCSQSQLLEMQNGGMHISNHGYQHYWWDKLSKEELREETNMSLDYLNSIGINVDNWTFCYPYGSFSEEAKDILKEFGCKAAFTTVNEKAILNKKNRFSLSRIDTNNLLSMAKSKNTR